MKLKPIEDGMVVHVSNVEDAMQLFDWAYKCGYEGILCWTYDAIRWRGDVCYVFGQDKYISWNFKDDLTQKNYEKCIEFEDLIIMEEMEEINKNIKEATKALCKGFEDGLNSVNKDEHMTAEEIIEWLIRHDCTEEMQEVFSYGDICIQDYDDVMSQYSPKDIVRLIEEYESGKKSEPKIKWVYRVYNTKENKYEFYDFEIDAIAKCEYLAKTLNDKDRYFKYDKICMIEE